MDKLKKKKPPWVTYFFQLNSFYTISDYYVDLEVSALHLYVFILVKCTRFSS